LLLTFFHLTHSYTTPGNRTRYIIYPVDIQLSPIQQTLT
jgi:hypothetical protein